MSAKAKANQEDWGDTEEDEFSFWSDGRSFSAVTAKQIGIHAAVVWNYIPDMLREAQKVPENREETLYRNGHYWYTLSEETARRFFSFMLKDEYYDALKKLVSVGFIQLEEYPGGVWIGATGQWASTLSAQPLPQKAQKNAKGHVYLIAGNGLHKIGYAKDVPTRFEQFLKLPFEIKLVASYATENMIEAEAGWHRRFASKRVRGEWFDLTLQDVAEFVELAGDTYEH